MKNNLSSVQRRLLKEQDEEELELEVPEGEEVEPSPPEGEEVEPSPPEGEEGLGEVPLEEPGEEAAEAEGETDKVDLITKTIDSLEQMRNDANKKGLLAAMHLSDYSTQRRLEAIADELGEIIKHLNSKVLKTVAKSPMEVSQTTDWLAGETGEGP